MFRNCWAAAWRHMSGHRLLTAIGIGGLAIGMCAALMAALIVDHELTYDRFIPGYDRTYLAVNLGAPADRPFMYTLETSSRLAPLLAHRFPQIESVARIAEETVVLRHGRVSAREKIYWADPRVFEVLPLPAIAGDLRAALRRPDGIVLPRSLARKYFGRDDPIGRTLLLGGAHPMTVTAVINDLPSEHTQLDAGVFASGLAPYSRLARLDRDPASADDSPAFAVTVRTYLRLHPQASLGELLRAVPQLVKREWPRAPPFVKLSLAFVPLDRVHGFAPLDPGFRGRVTLIAAIGALVLLIACVNFINLLTAHAAMRATEVGVRKAAGASRPVLIVQFIGEALLQVLLATLLAAALAEWALPHVGAFLTSGARFDYWRRPMLIVWLALGAVALGAVVGAYPAFVLSALRPAGVLGRSAPRRNGAGLLRPSLIAFQFAALIALIIAAGVVQRQHRFATHRALRADTDQVLIIRAPCDTAFVTELRRLPGVRVAACSGSQLLGQITGYVTHYLRPDGGTLSLDVVSVEPAVFDVLGLKLTAGAWSGASYARAQSTESNVAGGMPHDIKHFVPNRPYVLNEAAVHALGFASPQVAVGRFIRTRFFGVPVVIEENRIDGVAPDFTFASVAQPIGPTAYVRDPRRFTLIEARLAGDAIPETLAAIDRLWARTGEAGHIDRFFLDGYIDRLYRSIQREAEAFAALSLIAVLLACLGLHGLSASIVERRTKEIGVRRALGAGRPQVVQLLLWHFAQPVLWGSLIAWPLAGYFLSRWLHGYAYHVPLEPWIFAAATGAALLIALVSVSVQAFRAARSAPVEALRYE